MNWFTKLLPSRIRTEASQKKGVPEGLWSKCDQCLAIIYRFELEKNFYVCPKCDHHMYVSARERLNRLLDEGDRIEIGTEIKAVDHLKFRDLKKYKDRLLQAQRNSNEDEALISFQGYLQGFSIVASAFEYQFIGGSMGAAVGQRFVAAVNAAIQAHCPFICFSASGGARMQEALISLMQMAKVSAALAELSDQGLPYISVLTNPTMGGVSASLATLGDIIIAEPKALIGFAGPRVIEQTIRETLPSGFQTSEFLLEHGAIDMIVPRLNMRSTIAGLLSKIMHY